jgi:hypothetical protein
MNKLVVLAAGAAALALMPAAGQASQHRSQQSTSGEQTEMSGQTGMPEEGMHGRAGMDGGGRVDVALGFIRGADVVGTENEEIGDVVDIVRPSGDAQGLSVVVDVESGWFGDEQRRIVAGLDRFTVTEDGYLRLEGATEDSIEDYEEYAEDDWEVVGEDYETYEDVYEGLDWDW